jgi:hypothetical protein
MKTEFIVRGYFATSEVDNFENGCHGKTTVESLSASAWQCKADTLDSLIEALKAEFKCDDVMLNCCAEAGRLELQCMQKEAFQCHKVSDKTMEKFKAGDIDLYLTNYTFHVKIVQSQIDLRMYTEKKYDSEAPESE